MQKYNLVKLETSFSKIAKQLQETKDIETQSFIEVYTAICEFLVAIGSVMHFVKYDVSSKLSKIEEVYKNNLEKGKTVTQLIDHEVSNEIHKHSKSGTKNILPLARAFEFIHLFLHHLSKSDEELASCARKAYGNSISKYHAYLIRNTVHFAFTMLPYRKDFLNKMEYSKEEPIIGIKKIGEIIPPIFEQLRNIYSTRNLGF